MTKAINTHVRLHVEEMKRNNVLNVQILRSRTEIESALIEEILKEINYQNVLTPQENRKTIRKTTVRYSRYGKLKMQKIPQNIRLKIILCEKT
jgi:uncharacterized membrane protein